MIIRANYYEFPEHLTKYYRKIGLSDREYILINMIYANPSLSDIDSLSREIGESPDSIRETIAILYEKGFSLLNDASTQFDLDMVKQTVYSFHNDSKSLAHSLYQAHNHTIQAEVKPWTIIRGSEQRMHVLVTDTWGYAWPLKDMEKLTNELNRLLKDIDQADLDAYNQQHEEHRNHKEQAALKTKAIEEEKKKNKKPVPGSVLLYIAFPRGLYVFTRVTTSLEQKKASLQKKNGGPIELIHEIKTIDVNGMYSGLMDLFKERKQDGNWFDLTPEEVRYVTEQSYPPKLDHLLN